ncbi:MAG: sigma 54-dependent Fis family transcriptional regulator [Myxococcales bacterium]|nr:sigma 54-dependent Fis family transcriptional regulator [Myxococcales bacterium]
MHVLEVHRDSGALHRRPLKGRSLEIGRAGSCDIALEDAGLAERHWLVLERGGTVVVHDVSGAARSRDNAHVLGLDDPFPLGRDHVLVRRAVCTSPHRRGLDTGTRSLGISERRRLSILLHSGGDARLVAVRERPLHVGRGHDNDLRVQDDAASLRHCRIEPSGASVLLRDLDSRNGTYLNGAKVSVAELRDGDVLRVGRSELRLVGHVAAHAERGGSSEMVAACPRMLGVMSEARRYAALPWPVLIRGESGSGKEGIARLLHTAGPRHGEPWVALNAGGISQDLVESELFGHERGAFTGASGARRGVFEQADGGTLFLDEIGELPASSQTRLLRVLETGEVRRIGAESGRSVDVRIVCATHRDLRALVARGSFREDLYYRLVRLAVEVPPLRERPQDIELLSQHFLALDAEVVGLKVLSEQALERLLAHGWPGNVRELRNVLSAAAAQTTARRLEWEDIEGALRRVGAGGRIPVAHLRRVLDRHGGNLAAAARSLSMPRTTLRDRLKEVDREDLLEGEEASG